ncbi:uncharacterized protein LOC131942968 [Physella acuta]|uniref:uncharacterized protein LOC131942968 n=1 Tax=Physella acuta TaxID=109671 RepID=UPI0027DC136D|nr:uncharacterized protein LOC131942968 [Physella acuta]
MSFYQRLSFLLALFVYLSLYASADTDLFGPGVTKGTVGSNQIVEASGLAASRLHDGVLYVHNDKGDSSRFFAVDVNTGHKLATFTVLNAQNYDWEDITIGACADDCARTSCSATITPARYCIYIADTGDHGGDGAKNIIYMLREPTRIADSDISAVDTLTFSWSEQDAETLMIAPDGRLFIISKVHGGQGAIAQLPSSAWGQGRVSLDMAQTAKLKLSTTNNDPQGGDISPDGREMLIVAEQNVYYFSVPSGDYIQAVRDTPPARVSSYHPQPATEAIAWSPNGRGFYVMAEGANQKIYFYPKLTGSLPVG